MTLLSITMSPVSSERVNANAVMSFASWNPAGSRRGTFRKPREVPRVLLVGRRNPPGIVGDDQDHPPVADAG